MRSKAAKFGLDFGVNSAFLSVMLVLIVLLVVSIATNSSPVTLTVAPTAPIVNIGVTIEVCPKLTIISVVDAAKPVALTTTLYLPGGTCKNRKLPFESVVTVLLKPRLMPVT